MQTLGFSSATIIHTPPAESVSEALGFSTIYVMHSEEPVTECTAPAPTPEEATTKTRKRKGKAASLHIPYALKRTLDDVEAKKIATAPPIGTSATTATTPSAPKPTLAPTPTPTPKPKTLQTTKARPPTHPSTPKSGIVVHGIALRKDLGNVRRWMEADNKDIGRITGIGWLIKKTTLREEGKKTSSVVVYLEDTFFFFFYISLLACRPMGYGEGFYKEKIKTNYLAHYM
ncbi:hypothetical protein BDZ91DRAFT_736891 [Kalaharituber pfeilii]|nr:hypothetical protein BDZ91DRAFT_736891 [Kalaharituber pfeilii]